MSEFAGAREIRFQLYDLLDTEALATRARFSGQGRDVYDAVLDTAERVAAEYFAPHTRAADLREPWLEDGKVTLLPEVKAALDAFAAAGFLGAHHDEALGGLQLPWTVTQACLSYFQAANIATTAYPFLTIAAGNLLARFADEAQQRRYLKPMLAGRYFGTMCLSEPQAGSSLSDIKTTARPRDNGSYALRGTKQWISGGEHELAENIVHLVLARTEGAPPGAKGLSLFIVPRYRVNDDGNRGTANDIALVSLLHKMGYRGTVSTILNFGENDRCVAYLIGEPNQGLAYMFQMMNEARIGVGLGAAMLAHAGYLHALDYAKTRLQGRHPGGKDTTAPPVAIVEHADVKRMLLAQKAYAEGAMALCFYAARLVDDEMTAPDEAARQDAGLLLELLTPICKTWPSDYGPRANDLAIQVLGGYGYTRDYPVEQYYRDNRLNPIHEGTNGIQAIDLLGRKAGLEDGRALALLSARIAATCQEAFATQGLTEHARALEHAVATMRQVTETHLRALAAGKRNEALANASLYAEALGHVIVAWMWLRQALVAERRLAAAAPPEADYLRGKRQACRYFFAYELPRVAPLAAILERMEQTCAETSPDWL